MRYFGRVLRLVWPHRKYLFIAVVAMIGVAISLTASLFSLYPILTVIIGQESIPEFVDRLYVQDRLGADLAVRDTQGLDIAKMVGERAAKVVKVKPGRPLMEAGVQPDDYLNGLAEAPTVRGRDLIRRLAETPTEEQVRLLVWTPGTSASRPVSVALREAAIQYQWLRWGLAKFNFADRAEQTLEARMADRRRILAIILLVFFGIQLLGNLCRFVGEYYGAVVGGRTMIDLRRMMYAKAMTLPVGFFQTRGISDTMSRFTQDTQDVLRALNTVFGKVLREPLKAIGALGVAVVLEPRLTLMLIVIAPIAVLLFRQFGKRIRRANEKMLAGYGMLISALKSTLLGIRVVKAYTMEHQERKRYFKVERHILKNQLRIEKVNATSSPALEVLGIGAGCIAVYIVMLMIMRGSVRQEELFTLLVALGIVLDSGRKMSNVYTQLQRANAGAKRIFELIDQPSEFDLASGTEEAFPPKRRILFQDLVFRYDGSEHAALDGVTLEVPSGSVVAVVGPNGSGKTTLVSMLLRFYEPKSGQVLWDDEKLENFALRSLRRHISYVSQETVIFADTIANNIAYGRPGALREDVMAAARQAPADEFIERLARKDDTVVGEHGATLSGGERQRLAIARAILRDAPVLIFDEATSQIDAESEKKIQDAIDHFMPGRTALVIAHRFSTIKHADMIVVMDRGKIVSSGTHQELIEASPLYQQLYQTQLHGLQEQ